MRGLDPQISAVSTRDCIDSRSRESSDVALFVVDYHDGRVRVCVVSVFAERPSYASDYDDDDNDSLLADDSDARYQPVFRLERFTQSLIYSLTAHINCSETSSVAAGFGRHGMPPPAYNLTFDRLTLKLMCESSKVRNFSSKFGHASPLGSRIICYVCDGRADRQRDGRTKATLLPLRYGWRHNNQDFLYSQQPVITNIEVKSSQVEHYTLASRHVLSSNNPTRCLTTEMSTNDHVTVLTNVGYIDEISGMNSSLTSLFR